jgi:hypothetical protein
MYISNPASKARALMFKGPFARTQRLLGRVSTVTADEGCYYKLIWFPVVMETKSTQLTSWDRKFNGY